MVRKWQWLDRRLSADFLFSCYKIVRGRVSGISSTVAVKTIANMLKLLFLVAFVAGASATRIDKVFFLDTIFSTEERIIGGQKAENNQFPYQAQLFTNTHFFCSGSIIAKRFILTAASCTQGNLSSPSNVVARVGYADTHQGYTLSKIKNHPKYKRGKLSYDISVLKTKKTIEFSDSVQLIALPKADVPKTNVPATVSGWGQYRVSIEFSPSTVTSSLIKTFIIQICSQATGIFQKIFHLNCNGQTR